MIATVAMALGWMTAPYDDISAGIGARTRNPLAVEGDVLADLLFATRPARHGGLGGLGRAAVAPEPEGDPSAAQVGPGRVVGSLLLFAAGFAGGPVVTAAAMIPLPAAIVLAVLRLGLWTSTWRSRGVSPGWPSS